jgi:transcriptional regulator with XRE-family HTH domain
MGNTNFGNLLRIEREKRGWDQAALAKAANTKQQSVSRWESGLSRPREDMVHRLAELFDADTDEWLIQAGYMIDKPVRPLVPFLPLDKLSEEMFELFCRDFIQKLHPRADVHRYGHQGHKQYGIDLFAKENAAKTDYQCKRHQQFGPEKVRKAVKDTTMVAAHHYLLLSRQATPDARDAINEDDDWSLWDVEDISAKVRYLPKQDALDLIDTYFPDWRQHFLGVEAPSPWLSPDKYFRPISNKLQVFSHGWNFFGRQTELKQLTDFASDNTTAAMIVSGIGGVGKTRLLKEMAGALELDMKVVFMTQRADPTAADLEILPKSGMLAIDDAHEYSDLQALLSGIAVARPHLKVLISTRPYGVTMLEDQLLQAGLVFKHEDKVTLGKMAIGDAEKLALEILRGNNGDEEQAHRIAEITLDCPLATVIGARLVADGEIKPEVLANSENFRSHLLRRFRDIISGKIGGVKDADAITALMDLIAVVQPVDPDTNFEAVATEILGRPYDKTVRDMRALEDAGVLIRRKNRLRIAPDLLADFIRADAAYNPNSKSPTGYVDRVFKKTKNELATNLLANLSQLDWRLSTDGTQAALLAAIWKDLEKQFLAGDIGVREEMLKALEKVAYYQPEQAIRFARLAIDNPTDKLKKTRYDRLLGGKRTYGSVLAKVPPLLKYASYNGEFVLEALDILRLMAKNDNRDPGRTTDHPVSIMRHIAGIQPGKPMGYIETVNNHILGWLDDGTEGFSPFDVLDGALATEGHHTEFKGITLTMTPFRVNADAMDVTRNKVIDAAFKAVEHGPLIEAVRAMKTIEEALRGPWGNDVTPEERAKWEPGQIAILERLQRLVADTKLDPFIAVEARRAVNWHATYSKSDTKPVANAVLKAIPKTLDHKLARALADGWGWSFERSETDFQRDEAAFVEWRQRTAQELVAAYDGKLDQLISLLESRISVLDTIQRPAGGDAGPFIYTLVSTSDDFAKLLGQHIISNPGSPLATTIGVVINAISSTDHTAAVSLAADVLATGDVVLQRCVARSIGWGMYTNPVSEEEIPIIKILAAADDIYTRQNLIRVAKRFPEGQKQQALDILMGMTISDDVHLAGELLGEFDETHGAFKAEQLSPDHLENLKQQLIALDAIDEYQIAEFAGEVSLYKPEWVLELLFKRVESKRNDEKTFKYHPIPMSWGNRHGLRVSETAAYEKCLQAVRNWTNADPDNWYRHHYGPEIFKAVSAGYDDVTMRVISEWIVSSDPQQVQTAANLLSEFPSSFLWDHSDLVVDLLERARKLGEECYKRVSSSLHSAAIQGSRTGTPGQPFQEDIDQRDQAALMMKKLPASSPAVKFYKSLHDIAVEAIKRDDIDEEDLFDD